MGTFSSEDLALVRRYAGLFFTPREVAMMVGLDPDDTAKACRMREACPEVHDAYHGGKLTEEAAHRDRVATLSKQGSSPAQTMITDWIEHANSKIVEG